MARFQTEKRSGGNGRRLFFALCIFAVVLILFFAGISAVSGDTDRRQKESLLNALNRSITHCYAIEGAYPESLEYLKEKYGVTYDENRFFVDYQTIGSNIYPNLTILEKRGS